MEKNLCMQKISILPSKSFLLEPFLIVFNIQSFQWCSTFLFFQKMRSELKDIPGWKSTFCRSKISALNSKLSVLEAYLIVSLFGLFDEVSFFSVVQKSSIWIYGYFRIENVVLHAKNQPPTFKTIHFKVYSYCSFIWVFQWGINIFYF